jgi:hypothetical protein
MKKEEELQVRSESFVGNFRRSALVIRLSLRVTPDAQGIKSPTLARQRNHRLEPDFLSNSLSSLVLTHY